MRPCAHSLRTDTLDPMKFSRALNSLHTWANRHEWLFLAWTLLIVLRLPNLVEPYWYGDEAIYLTIGTAMRHGLRLYKEIVDHKTPLIYFFAMFPSQFLFRIFTIGWMIATTGFFHSLAKRFFSSWVAFATTIAFVLLTSLPSFEGHIPNGELFVMGFILAAFWIMSKTSWFASMLDQKHHTPVQYEFPLIFAAGFVASLGIMTKVPALLDMGALGAFFLFTLLATWKKKMLPEQLQHLIQTWIAFAAGVAVPIILSLMYFALRGSLADYVQFGLLYNFHYSGNWTLPFNNALLLQLFTLPGKAVILGVILIVTIGMSLWNKRTSALSWMLFWMGAALFGALLSNRPYPHYFQQVVPPFALLLGFLIAKKSSLIGRAAIVLLFALSASVLVLLKFRPYAIVEYYQKYIDLVSGKMTKEQYLHSFNYLVEQNEVLIPIIQEGSTEKDRIFIWGTNPMLYAQSRRSPASKFTVSFHIHDLKVYEQTMEELRANKPMFIVLMKGEPELPGLNEYINEHYLESARTGDMILYRRSSLTSLQLLQ